MLEIIPRSIFKKKEKKTKQTNKQNKMYVDRAFDAIELNTTGFVVETCTFYYDYFFLKHKCKQKSFFIYAVTAAKAKSLITFVFNNMDDFVAFSLDFFLMPFQYVEFFDIDLKYVNQISLHG